MGNKFQSPGQRRRAGIPVSNVASDRGGAMIEDPMATALAGMSSGSNPRQPMDKSVLQSIVNRSQTGGDHGLLHPRYSAPVNDPSLFPVARPQNVPMENGGARFGIRVNMNPPTLPEAGPTQANGRVITARGRSGSFWDG